MGFACQGSPDVLAVHRRLHRLRFFVFVVSFFLSLSLSPSVYIYIYIYIYICVHTYLVVLNYKFAGIHVVEFSCPELCTFFNRQGDVPPSRHAAAGAATWRSCPVIYFRESDRFGLRVIGNYQFKGPETNMAPRPKKRLATSI